MTDMVCGRRSDNGFENRERITYWIVFLSVRNHIQIEGFKSQLCILIEGFGLGKIE